MRATKSIDALHQIHTGSAVAAVFAEVNMKNLKTMEEKWPLAPLIGRNHQSYAVKVSFAAFREDSGAW